MGIVQPEGMPRSECGRNAVRVEARKEGMPRSECRAGHIRGWEMTAGVGFTAKARAFQTRHALCS